MSIMGAVMLNPDEEMDSLNLYHPDLKPITQDELDELASLFAFLFEEEKAA